MGVIRSFVAVCILLFASIELGFLEAISGHISFGFKERVEYASVACCVTRQVNYRYLLQIVCDLYG